MNLIPPYMSLDDYRRHFQSVILANSLVSGDVHLWWADLRDLSVFSLFDDLSAEEQTRAGILKRELISERFIRSHVLVRHLLSLYLQMDLKQIHYQVTKEGKPHLTQNLNQLDLNFNFSHSDDILLIAVARSQSVGVDVQVIEKKINFLDIAKRFFSTVEFEELNQSKNIERDFYSIWTAKEAIVKASGLGISAGLQDFTVLLTELSAGRVAWQEKIWCTQRLDPPFPDCMAALATDKKINQISSFYLNSNSQFDNFLK